MKEILFRKATQVAVTISFVLLLSPIGFARAQNAPQKGISVTPSIMHVDLATDPPEYELTYTNNTNFPVNLNLSVQDFTELEDTYQIQFLQGKDAANYKYSLSSWIMFETRNIELNPGEKRSVKIYIDKNRITKGGHYASILAEIVAPENKAQINIKGILSSLLFVRASTGQEIEDARISTFIPSRDGIEYPDSYILGFNNMGNVHVIPYGLVQVYDPLGNLVAKGILDINSLDALPESIRRYDIQVTNLQKILLPGFYTARVSIEYGKTHKTLSASVRFFSQGMFDFGKIGMILIAGVILIVYLRRKRASG